MELIRAECVKLTRELVSAMKGEPINDVPRGDIMKKLLIWRNGKTIEMTQKQFEKLNKNRKEELDMSACRDIVTSSSESYENSRCSSATGESSYEFGIR